MMVSASALRCSMAHQRPVNGCANWFCWPWQSRAIKKEILVTDPAADKKKGRLLKNCLLRQRRLDLKRRSQINHRSFALLFWEPFQQIILRRLGNDVRKNTIDAPRLQN